MSPVSWSDSFTLLLTGDRIMELRQSLGWSLYKAAMFACGLRAMFIAAAAVSSGVVPDVPLLRALLNRAVQLMELGELELMHADRMFARV